MMPKESWVARWNRLEHLVPGIYAISYKGEEE
jgi:hypothetical protein